MNTQTHIQSRINPRCRHYHNAENPAYKCIDSINAKIKELKDILFADMWVDAEHYARTVIDLEEAEAQKVQWELDNGV